MKDNKSKNVVNMQTMFSNEKNFKEQQSLTLLNPLYCQNNNYNMIYNKYKNYALDIFRWENLPEGIESRHIENQLYSNGECFFYNNKALGLICLPCSDTRQQDIFGDYTKGMVSSYNGLINEEVDYRKDGVHIWNNDTRTPTSVYIKNYSKNMTQVEQAIQMNVNQQQFPYFITCNKQNELSWRQMYRQIINGEPAIFHSENMSIDEIKVLPTLAPYVVDKLNLYRFELEREILTFLGINNNFEKKERLLIDEINSNNEFIYRNIEIQFKHRQQAAEAINKKFGLNVKVVKVADIIRQHEQMLLNEEEKQEEGESINVE